MALLPKHKRLQQISPNEWVKSLFAQPAAVFYQKPSVYLSGNELELQNFRAVVDYNEAYLLVDLGRERLRITGDALVILSLEKGRLVLSGRVLSIVFSDE